MGKNTILHLVLEEDILVAPLLRSRAVQHGLHSHTAKIKMSKATGSQPSKPIEIEDDHDWPDQGAGNEEEAQAFVDKINNIFDTFSDRVWTDDKDTLPKLIHEYKNMVKKHWCPMAEADEQVVVASVYDRNCIYLRQHLDPSGVTTYKPEFEWKEGWEFLRDMLEKKRSHEVKMMIIDAMDHASAAWSPQQSTGGKPVMPR